MRLVVRVLCAILPGLCFASLLAAQETLHLKHGPNTPVGRQLLATVDFVDGGGRIGGYGYVAVQLENPDGLQHKVKLVVSPAASRLRMYRFARTVTLDKRTQARVYLPLPNGNVQMKLGLSVDGFQALDTRHNRLGKSETPTILLVTEDNAALISWEAKLKSLALSLPPLMSTRSHVSVRGGKKGGTISLQQRRSSELPPRWDMLSGFDGLIVDGRTLGVGEQAVLRKFLRAGGNLLVYHADVVPEGVLRSVWGRSSSHGAQWGIEGFGSYLVIDSLASAYLPGGPLPKPIAVAFDRWLGVNGTGGVLGGRLRPLSGPVTSKGYLPAKIPGLGEISLRLFFLFTLAFGVLVGPVSYLYWRGQRKLPMLLVTVPAFGFGCTLVVLAYGLMSEGLGVKGVIRSVTLLNQETHEAVSWSSRTVYAGLAPGALRPASDTFLGSLYLALDWSSQLPHAFQADFTDGRKLTGGLVPSRYPTCLVAVNLGTARQRMRIKRREDGGFDLLSTPEFRAGKDSGDLLLRDFDGRYFLSEGDRLVRLTGGEARAWPGKARFALTELLSRWDQPSTRKTTPARRGYPNRFDSRGQQLLSNHKAVRATQSAATGYWPEQVISLLEDGMAKGSYVALVETEDAVDDLGLEVDWLKSWHLVLGTLSKEDVLE